MTHSQTISASNWQDNYWALLGTADYSTYVVCMLDMIARDAFVKYLISETRLCLYIDYPKYGFWFINAVGAMDFMWLFESGKVFSRLFTII